MTPYAKGNIKSMEISAVKITADGRRVPLGTLAFWHRNPFVRLWRWIRS